MKMRSWTVLVNEAPCGRRACVQQNQLLVLLVAHTFLVSYRFHMTLASYTYDYVSEII